MTNEKTTADKELRSKILQALSEDERVVALELRVGVLNGIAHLAGFAPDAKTRSLAEEIVAQIEGVRGIVNRIDAPGAPSPSRTVHLNFPATDNAANEGGKQP